MKKLYTLMMFAVGFGASVSCLAQQGPDLRTQATERSRKLAQQISLDDARSIHVRRLTYARLVQEDEAARLYAADPATQQTKLRVISEEYTEKLKAVLSETQFLRYTALNAASSTAATPAIRP